MGEWPYKGYKIPDCYPTEGCSCLDDCMVSCPLWEECLEYEEENEQSLPEADECINEESTYCKKCPHCGPCQGYPPQSVLEGNK